MDDTRIIEALENAVCGQSSALQWQGPLLSVVAGVIVALFSVYISNWFKKISNRKAVIGLFAEHARLVVIHSIKDIGAIGTLRSRLINRKPTLSYAMSTAPLFDEYMRNNIDSLPKRKYIPVSLAFMKENRLRKQLDTINRHVDHIYDLYMELLSREAIMKPKFEKVKVPKTIVEEYLPEMLCVANRFENACDHLSELYKL